MVPQKPTQAGVALDLARCKEGLLFSRAIEHHPATPNFMRKSPKNPQIFDAWIFLNIEINSGSVESTISVAQSGGYASRFDFGIAKVPFNHGVTGSNLSSGGVTAIETALPGIIVAVVAVLRFFGKP